MSSTSLSAFLQSFFRGYLVLAKRVQAQVLAQPLRFANQGSVVAGWRVYRGRRLGPYFRLAYRDGARQRSIYLGRCAELARRVRDLLAGLQRWRRQRRLCARLMAQVRASLRRAKGQLRELLAPWNIHLKGFEFRGSRRSLLNPYSHRIGAGTFNPRRPSAAKRAVFRGQQANPRAPNPRRPAPSNSPQHHNSNHPPEPQPTRTTSWIASTT